MMIDESENGLKGQYNLAQGNPPAGGDALGLESGHENRPRKNVHKRENLNSDEINLSFFMGILPFLSVRKKLFALFSVFTRTVFLLHPIPRAAFLRSFRNSALGYDILALQAGKNAVINLCIKSSSRREGKSTFRWLARLTSLVGQGVSVN
jgi:hypothetical protein